MLDIVIATSNPHKFRELSRLLRVPGICWHSLAEFPAMRPVREDGGTFEANAVKKARAVARATGHLALADDSGIEVAALRGAPGVQSARFAGAHVGDAANNAKLLRRMAGVPAKRRAARYRCVLALASASRTMAIARGSWAGRIAQAPKGRGGFGYDPIVVIPRLGKTVGQLPARVKRRFSHRAQAARRLLPLLRHLVKTR
ncbi:MAG: non-canonical purine NTP pyrophosphatase [Candidatus Omnitrophica bacterium]|nr:non-canonical purine NTP pyrophosphatase [Candidatus Omnitrophota bacterium]